jgi:hypothetical protein
MFMDIAEMQMPFLSVTTPGKSQTVGYLRSQVDGPLGRQSGA